MTLEEIKAAVEAGQTVHWTNELYRVIKDDTGQWLIHCRPVAGHGDVYWGLTWQDGVTMNGSPDQFYIAD